MVKAYGDDGLGSRKQAWKQNACLKGVFKCIETGHV